MQRVILQVPMSKELKEKTEAVSESFGFSSLQEMIRVVLTKLAQKEISFRVIATEDQSDLQSIEDRADDATVPFEKYFKKRFGKLET